MPTHERVLWCYFEERLKLSTETNNKSERFSKVSGTVAEKIKSLYDKASITTVSDCRIVHLINAYNGSYYKIRKLYNRDKDKTSFNQKTHEFKLRVYLLFDVVACKYVLL